MQQNKSEGEERMILNVYETLLLLKGMMFHVDNNLSLNPSIVLLLDRRKFPVNTLTTFMNRKDNHASYTLECLAGA